MRADRSSKRGGLEPRTIAWLAIIIYVSAAVFLLPKLAFWASGIPVLGWPLLEFAPRGLFEFIVPLVVIGTAGISARSVVPRETSIARRGIWHWLSDAVVIAWESVTLVAVIAFVLDVTGAWGTFVYREASYDPASQSVFMRGIWPKESWPMLWVWAASLTGVGLIYWFLGRWITRGKSPVVAWTGLTAVSGIAVLAGFALQEHRLGTPASMYTGLCVTEIFGLLVLSWSAGTGIFVIAEYLTGTPRKIEG